MLKPDVAVQIEEHLRLLRYPIELVTTLDESDDSAVIEQLADEVAVLSDLVTVRTGPHVRRPSFAVIRPGTDIGLRFAGPPTGDALSALVLALVHVGGHPPRIDDTLADRVRALDVPVELETWFATSCRSCGETLHAFNAISVLNPLVRHTAINGAAFRAEADARGIRAVPVAFVNGERLGQGRMSIERAVDLLEDLTS